MSEFALKYLMTNFTRSVISSKPYIELSLNFTGRYYTHGNIWWYIFQIKWSLETYYFRRSKLLDESYQIC
jgi:hypothetical protein